jgi:hypothetical protein
MSDQSRSELLRHRSYALIVVSIGTFMTPCNSSIVAVALKALGGGSATHLLPGSLVTAGGHRAACARWARG